jgi:hypothetical protein
MRRALPKYCFPLNETKYQLGHAGCTQQNMIVRQDFQGNSDLTRLTFFSMNPQKTFASGSMQGPESGSALTKPLLGSRQFGGVP